MYLYSEIDDVKTYSEFNILKYLLIDFLREISNIQKDEINKLLENINIGLCIIDKNFNIGNTYSKEILNILNIESIDNQNLYTLLEPLILNKEKANAFKDYTELINNSSIKDNFLKTINPLKEVLVSIEQAGKIFEKHLLCDFNFIKNESAEREFSIVTIKDNTDIYLLKEEIEENKRKEDNEYLLLQKVLNNHPLTIKEFIEHSINDLNQINTLLQEDKPKEKYYQLLETIFRITHNIKGNASIIDMPVIVEMAHHLEDKISIFLKEDKIANNNIIMEIGVKINAIKSEFKLLKKLIERIQFFIVSYYTSNQKKLSENLIEELINNLQKFIDKINNQNEKVIKFDYSQFEKEKIVQLIEYQNLQFIKDCLIQLLGNSVSHGVETKKERKEKNKDTQAKLSLRTQIDSQHVKIIFQDDGRGINEQAIKEKAKDKGIEISNKSQEEIFNLIFLKGFSTSESISQDSGRGMGMDIIKDAIEKMKGAIKIESVANAFTRFIITLPILKK